MMEWTSKEAVLAAEEHYFSIQKKLLQMPSLWSTCKSDPVRKCPWPFIPAMKMLKKPREARRIPNLATRCGQRQFLPRRRI